eukprot:6374776-Lingulodinium_polyedra.AAC.1
MAATLRNLRLSHFGRARAHAAARVECQHHENARRCNHGLPCWTRVRATLARGLRRNNAIRHALHRCTA